MRANFEYTEYNITKTDQKPLQYLNIKGGVVVTYAVMQAYGSPALEDNSEAGEVVLGRGCISCVRTSAI